ncbi:MurR/RpiR family transcriptional regulator [Clostridium cellulovorans]|uniref:Transcriptional regulator, RpiR family n=1 Tax=Clostridium cellulovorans (strain ATCC 35296 / DSM 3052 / OCM 3 / 743B) TaxID=573061 RepID=D9SSR6_CLOC7|nr:MurR/RpiR family transcriptional regulator [Clostridium cellulovorans]ADL52578.1 transcriptional regulator, RpiR family [Clostridium cellulovorans 743B]
MFNVGNVNNLNDLELQLYRYISENMEKVVYMRIRELAQETHVSTTTIIRFCKAMGCEGYSDFKTMLKLYLKEYKRNDSKLMLSTGILEDFLERVVNGDLDDAMNKAAKLIHEQENVLFIGIGNSGHSSGYGARYLSSLGKFALYIDDPYYPLTGDIIKNSVTIAISVSGESDSILRLTNIFKERGSKIISVTNRKSSPLSKMADVNISYYIQQESFADNGLEYRDITSQVPSIFIVETIAKKVHELMNNREL